MTAEDALAYLVAEDAARRTMEGRDKAYALRLGGIGNRKRLVAWRRENRLCPKCGARPPPMNRSNTVGVAVRRSGNTSAT